MLHGLLFLTGKKNTSRERKVLKKYDYSTSTGPSGGRTTYGRLDNKTIGRTNQKLFKTVRACRP